VGRDPGEHLAGAVHLEDGAHLLRRALDDRPLVGADRGVGREAAQLGAELLDLLRRHEVLEREVPVTVETVELGAVQGSVVRRAPHHGVLPRDLGGVALDAGRVQVRHTATSVVVSSSVTSGYTPSASCTSLPVTGGLNVQMSRRSVFGRIVCRSCPSSRYIVPSEIWCTSPVSRFTSSPSPPTQYTASMWFAYHMSVSVPAYITVSWNENPTPSLASTNRRLRQFSPRTSRSVPSRSASRVTITSHLLRSCSPARRTPCPTQRAPPAPRRPPRRSRRSRTAARPRPP